MARTYSRRDFLRLAALGTASLTLAACAKQAETPAATSKPSEPQPTVAPPVSKQIVTFTMYGHPGMIEEMVPIFNASHDDVEVQFERSEGQGYWEKLTAAVAAGTAWDCFRGGPNQALGWGA